MLSLLKMVKSLPKKWDQLLENFTKNKLKYQFSNLDLSKDFNILDYYINDSIFIRVFNQNIEYNKFVWHRDEKDRDVDILYADPAWSFQFDDQLPFPLKSGDKLTIKSNVYHRLLKGKGTLILLIKEIN